MPDDNAAPSVPRDIFGDPLLHLLLERAINTDPRLEGLLVAERRRLLEAASRGDPTLAGHGGRFLSALAQQCYLNEYVFDETPEETDRVDALLDAIVATLRHGRRIDHAALALLATYRPLRELSCAPRILRCYSPGANDFLYPVIRLQLIAPTVEQGLRDDVERLTAIRDPVSRSVRQQYEANPYPRWLYTDHHHPAPLADYLRRMFPHLGSAALPQGVDQPRVLIAGCGTGKQAISAAMRIAGADVLALDLSMASLCYGMRMAGELGLSGIRWARGDILELDASAASFDLIECVGVLHHLDDPLAGWHVLTRCLRPGGIMRVGLYSRRARQSVEKSRAWVREQALTPTLQGIRALRRHIYDLPEGHPAKSLVLASDFYATSECRDLVFHVREHQFSLHEIAGLLERLGLGLIGFEFGDGRGEARYRSLFPADRSMQDLHRWQAVEDHFPDTFASMYQFWVRKI